jgi:UDP-N-acetyl-D-glucosamine/UDP-N-acetyl-D-galactosamine dehydrogenase
MQLKLNDVHIAIIGLGYVGLPLAVEFGKKYPTLGFDLNAQRISELEAAHDSTGEVTADQLIAPSQLNFSSRLDHLNDCNVFIIAVPTPIDDSRRPDLTPLIAASRTVGKVITAGGIVIYESTVYPGATEEDCIPIVEQVSGLQCNKDFYAGYSPERINPGDKKRPLTSIVKVTSGSTPEISEFVDQLYASIIEAGTYRASSIRVAEASKVIENTQRDVNIALVNELSIVFSRLGIDTNEVLDAAATKWNFIRLTPGLVGGHCIGVDPYYLLHKSIAAGYVPDIIRDAREINDGMAKDVAGRVVKAMILRDIPVRKAHVLIIGFTFKENCPDVRNTKVIDLVFSLKDYGMNIDVVDTWADPKRVMEEYELKIANCLPKSGDYQAVILAVPHQDIVSKSPEELKRLAPRGVFFDMKAVFKSQESDLRM